jgi:hypothetical protein
MFKTGYTVELGELVADMTGIRIPLDISWEGPNI